MICDVFVIENSVATSIVSVYRFIQAKVTGFKNNLTLKPSSN